MSSHSSLIDSLAIRSRLGTILLITSCVFFIAAVPVDAQHTIVLRNLTLIEDATVTSMNVDRVTLSNGLHFFWDQILQGDIGEKQTEFDTFVSNIGLPLYRIRTRMAHGDFRQLQPMANDLLARVGESTGRTAFVTQSACFHHQLGQGNREAAVIPLLEILSIRKSLIDASEIESDLGLQFTEEGLCLNLLPVWFDRVAASETLPVCQDQTVTPESRVYLRSLQTFVQDGGNGSRFVDDQSSWHPVLSAQSSLLTGNYQEVVDTLDKSSLNLSPPQHAIALYYVGLAMKAIQAQDAKETSDQWKLKLLQIPAQYQNRFPELSSAAIYEVVSGSLASSKEYDSLRKELTGRFAKTCFGRRYQSNRK